MSRSAVFFVMLSIMMLMCLITSDFKLCQLVKVLIDFSTVFPFVIDKYLGETSANCFVLFKLSSIHSRINHYFVCKD